MLKIFKLKIIFNEGDIVCIINDTLKFKYLIKYFDFYNYMIKY